MPTVFIVGAGASVAQAASYRPKQRRDHPPLDADFFVRAEDLTTRYDSVEKAVGALRKATDAVEAFPNPWRAPTPSLEQFFADVYYDVARAPASTEAFAVFVSLLKLYNAVIAETTNWMASNSRAGVLCKLLRAERRAAERKRVTLITFNQDLVLENEILRIAPRETWCVNQLYGLRELEPVVEEEKTSPEDTLPSHDGACKGHTGPFRLLKLHGSLNWVVRTRDKDPAPGTLFPTRRDKELFVSTDRLLDMGVRTVASEHARRQWYLWPLVVPPIYEKERITGMASLQRLWTAASRAIASADRVVLLGYSLPDADVSARQMLRRSLAWNRSLKCLDCVNPDPAVAAKLKLLLGSPVIRMFDDLDAYLEHVYAA